MNLVLPLAGGETGVVSTPSPRVRSSLRQQVQDDMALEYADSRGEIKRSTFYMLDPRTLKVGDVVQVTGKIVDIDDDDVYPFSIEADGVRMTLTEGHMKAFSLFSSPSTPHDLDHLQVGDVLVTSYGSKQKVLGICGDVYFLSATADHGAANELVTLKEIKEYGYTLASDVCEKCGKK